VGVTDVCDGDLVAVREGLIGREIVSASVMVSECDGVGERVSVGVPVGDLLDVSEELAVKLGDEDSVVVGDGVPPEGDSWRERLTVSLNEGEVVSFWLSDTTVLSEGEGIAVSVAEAVCTSDSDNENVEEGSDD